MIRTKLKVKFKKSFCVKNPGSRMGSDKPCAENKSHQVPAPPFKFIRQETRINGMPCQSTEQNKTFLNSQRRHTLHEIYTSERAVKNPEGQETLWSTLGPYFLEADLSSHVE